MATFSTEAASDALDAMNALANGGKIVVYSGTIPSDANAANTGTLQGTFTLNTPAFGAATNADPSVATLNGVPLSSTVTGAGATVTYARLLTSGDTPIQQYSVGQGSGEISFDNTTWDNGGTINLTALRISLPS